MLKIWWMEKLRRITVTLLLSLGFSLSIVAIWIASDDLGALIRFSAQRSVKLQCTSSPVIQLQRQVAGSSDHAPSVHLGALDSDHQYSDEHNENLQRRRIDSSDIVSFDERLVFRLLFSLSLSLPLLSWI